MNDSNTGFEVFLTTNDVNYFLEEPHAQYKGYNKGIKEKMRALYWLLDFLRSPDANDSNVLQLRDDDPEYFKVLKKYWPFMKRVVNDLVIPSCRLYQKF